MSVVRPKFFWPKVITASNKGIRINNGVSDATVNIAEGTYYSAESLRAAVETAIQTHLATAKVYITVQNSAYSESDRSGKFFFVDTSLASWQLLAGHANFTSYDILGLYALTYSAASKTAYVQRAGTGAGVESGTKCIVAPNQHVNGWYPEVPPYEDTLPIRDRGMNVQTRSVAGQAKSLLETEVIERRWLFRFLAAHKTYQDFESNNTRLNEAVERLWANGYDRFRYFPDELSESNSLDYVLSAEAMKSFEPVRQFPKKALYEYVLEAWKYVS